MEDSPSSSIHVEDSIPLFPGDLPGVVGAAAGCLDGILASSLAWIFAAPNLAHFDFKSLKAGGSDLSGDTGFAGAEALFGVMAFKGDGSLAGSCCLRFSQGAAPLLRAGEDPEEYTEAGLAVEAAVLKLECNFFALSRCGEDSRIFHICLALARASTGVTTPWVGV